MSREPKLYQMTVGELVEQLAADQPVPGSGAAAATALALCAACTCKAVAISLKHDPQSKPLRALQRQLKGIAREALAAGDVEARRFKQFLRTQGRTTARQLEAAGGQLLSLARKLKRILRDLLMRVDGVVFGDLVAAQALLAAAEAIQTQNLKENRAAARKR